MMDAQRARGGTRFGRGCCWLALAVAAAADRAWAAAGAPPPPAERPAAEAPATPAPPRAGTDAPPAPADPATVKARTARDWLIRYGIDESHFEKFVDGQAVNDEETEPLLKMLYRAVRFEPLDMERWAADRKLDPAALFAGAPKLRGEAFAVPGRLKRISVLQPVPEIAQRFDLKKYYRCEIELAAGLPAEIIAATVPNEWREGGAIAARVGALGVFVKCLGATADAPRPLFAASRLACYPQTPLGDLGMDYGLLDEVEDRKGILPPEREAFYQMLAAASRARPRQLLRDADEQLRQLAAEADASPAAQQQPADRNRVHRDEEGAYQYSVAPLFNRPATQRGHLVALSGMARRVEKVLVEDQDVRERFGITHYYQVAMFTEDSQGNPVFFCVRELPEGMPSGDSPRYGETVRVAGFFFKSWSYRIEIPMGLRNDPNAPAPQKQLAPLLLGRDLVWYPATAPQRNTLAGAIGVGLFCVAVAVVWIAVWRFNRGDRRRRFRTLGAGQPLDAGGALGQIELPPSPSPPDFSKLSDFDERPPSAGAQ